MGTDIVILGAQTCHLAGLVPLLWRVGGPFDDPAALGIQALIFSTLGGFQVSVSRAFFVLVPSFLFLRFLGLTLDVGGQKTNMMYCQKPTFHGS